MVSQESCHGVGIGGDVAIIVFHGSQGESHPWRFQVSKFRFRSIVLSRVVLGVGVLWCWSATALFVGGVVVEVASVGGGFLIE